MSKPANDNILLHGNKPLDAKYGPWPGTVNALAFLQPYMRCQGLVVGIITGDGSIEDYWFKDGIDDHDLVIKQSGGQGDKHHVYQINHQEYVGIQHGLGKKPSVTILDAQGNQVYANVEYVDQDTVTIRFSGYFSGTAIFN